MMIKYNLYRITSPSIRGSRFIECETEKDLIEYIVLNFQNKPVSIASYNRIGVSYPVDVYNNEYYNNLLNMNILGQLKPKVREIKENVYSFKDVARGVHGFIDAKNIKELIKFKLDNLMQIGTSNWKELKTNGDCINITMDSSSFYYKRQYDKWCRKH